MVGVMSKKLWTQAEVEQLLKDAAENEGFCSHCWRTIAVYRYNANKAMATILKRMAEATHERGKTAIDVDTLGLAHSQRTQLTKMRFHGLVAKVKDKDGQQIARHWVVTNKGWEWLKGEPIAKTVVVFDNQLLGHEGGTITIVEALGLKPASKELLYDKTAITEAEAQTYRDVRTPQKAMEVQAIFKGHDYTTGGLKPNQKYTLLIDKLQVGKAVNVTKVSYTDFKGVTIEDTKPRMYPDIASFMKNWQVVKQ